MSVWMMLSHMRRRKPTRKCERCGLRYPYDGAHCPHCHDLDDVGLERLLQKSRRERRGGRELGRMLLLAAGVGSLLILLFISLF